jgi:hypothetical protein
VRRLQRRWPNLILVHTAVHASWVNQIEIYFSITQRKGLTPNDFDSLAAVAPATDRVRARLQPDRRTVRMEVHSQNLNQLLTRLAERHPTQLALAA